MAASRPLQGLAASPGEYDCLPTDQAATLAQAESQMRRSGYSELRRVACDFQDGVLTLRGRVFSYHLKQLAQALVLELKGVRELDNRLEVVAPPHPR